MNKRLMKKLGKVHYHDHEALTIIAPRPDYELLVEDHWTVEVPELRGYAADLLTCLKSDTRRFLYGLRVFRETRPGFRGHIRFLTWIKGDNKIGASDYESLLHEIGHALDLREPRDQRVSPSLERAATAKPAPRATLTRSGHHGPMVSEDRISPRALELRKHRGNSRATAST